MLTASDSAATAELGFWPHERPATYRPLPMPIDVPATPRPWLSVAAVHGGAIVGNSLRPFQWVQVDDTGRVRFRSNDAAALDPRLAIVRPDDTIPNWIALPPLQLDSAYLRQLAHVRGESRLTQLFDTVGVLERGRATSAALGFIAADRGTNRLVGLATRGGEQSLVFYSWHWVRSPMRRGRMQ